MTEAGVQPDAPPIFGLSCVLEDEFMARDGPERRGATRLGGPVVRRAVALFSALVLLGAPPLAAQTDFCEQGGLIVMEVESAPTSGDWVEETVNPGFSGSYYRWAGPNHYNNPGQGILTYTFTVTTPGKYHLRIRNFHDNPDITLDNDAWTRMDGGSWLKVYSSLANKWLWQTTFDPPTGSDFDAFYNLTVGVHAFEISGRSHDFRIDRIHLFLNSVSDPLDPTHPETLCTWVDLGGGLAGSSGEPLLEGSGTLLPADPMTLTLAGTLP